MDETIDWLRDQGYYRGQITHQKRVPPQEAQFTDCEFESRLARALRRQGIDQPYQHQGAAIDAVRDGDNLVIATPTASGKSLTYTVPAVENALDGASKTLYIAPTVALLNDQADTLQAVSDALGPRARFDVATYTGKTSKQRRRSIRNAQPDVLLMTPDMIHMSLLPYAHSPQHWRWLFQQLDLVVVDEVHEFRGVFGSHVGLVFRRLNRLASQYGDAPQFICCSATIGNPVDHAAAVTDQEPDSFTLVDEDTSAAGARHWLFWNPPLEQGSSDPRGGGGGGSGHSDHGDQAARGDGGQVDAPDGDPTAVDIDVSVASTGGDDRERRSSHVESLQLFCDLVQRGNQTLVFTQSRQGAERYADWADGRLRDRGEPDLAETVTAYHAALTDDRRETIEQGLRTGDLRGVWSTNALELGIDIGTLDAVILDGYPGTAMETLQRAGRAGRGDDPALIVFVAGRNPLDQYVVDEPGQLFDGDLEAATVNPQNDQILADHICCAADESYLRPRDEAHLGEELPDVVADLTERGRLERGTDGNGVYWNYAESGSPQYENSIRSIDDRDIQLFDRLRGETIASLDYGDAIKDAHEGAIYTHQKERYRVVETRYDRNRAILESVDTYGYTQTLSEKSATVVANYDQQTLCDDQLQATFADLTVTKTVTGYIEYEDPSDDGQKVTLPDGPQRSIDTSGAVLTFPPSFKEEIEAANGVLPDDYRQEDPVAAALHAVEHTLISLFPLEVLCARQDVGGLSTPMHPQTGVPTIIVHDGHPGGVGLCRTAFDSLDELLSQTLSVLRQCDCDDGCPSCIHSPQCGNANETLSKHLAIHALETLGVEPDSEADDQGTNPTDG